MATYQEAVRSRFSIKSTFSRRSGNLRLVNVMGDNSDARWTDPTLFVVPELGIVLGHPGHPVPRAGSGWLLRGGEQPFDGVHPAGKFGGGGGEVVGVVVAGVAECRPRVGDVCEFFIDHQRQAQ